MIESHHMENQQSLPCILFAKNLSRIRMERGLTQTQLGKLAGINQANISRMESGKNDDPTVESAGRIAEALGIDIRELYKE